MFKKILITDDSGIARSCIRQCLEIVGLRDAIFLEAKDGIDALNVVEQHADIDLLLTDINMPKKSGEELLVDIKAKYPERAMKIIVISSLINSEKTVMLKTLGATAVMSKPVSPAKVAETFAKMIMAEK